MLKKEVNFKPFCRLCNSPKLSLVLKLESTPPANAFVQKKNINKKQKKYPLDVFFCESCFHVQLIEVVDPKELLKTMFTLAHLKFL